MNKPFRFFARRFAFKFFRSGFFPKGFTVLEVLVAISLASIGALFLINMLTGINQQMQQNRRSVNRTAFEMQLLALFRSSDLCTCNMAALAVPDTGDVEVNGIKTFCSSATDDFYLKTVTGYPFDSSLKIAKISLSDPNLIAGTSYKANLNIDYFVDVARGDTPLKSTKLVFLFEKTVAPGPPYVISTCSLSGASAVSSGWKLDGNSGSNPPTDFIGTTDNQNVVFKRNNLLSGIIANDNTSLGFRALQSNSGTRNSAFGADALITTSGSNNTALGYGSLGSNSTGSVNTAVGSGALSANTSGVSNTAIGYAALNNSTANANTAVGSGALTNTTSGSGNTGLGTNAIYSNTTGGNNTAIGQTALRSNTTGTMNVAVGSSALYGNTTASEGTAVGSIALFSNTTGYRNTAVGASSASQNTTGGWNTSVGAYSLSSNTTGNENNAFGSSALQDTTTGGSNVAVGAFAMMKNTTGASNVAIGPRVLFNATTGSQNTAIGQNAMGSGVNTGQNNVAIGNLPLYTNTSGAGNVAIGSTSLYLNTVGANNIAIGEDALRGNTSGNNNYGIGYNALYDNTTGDYNLAIGLMALRSPVSPITGNTAVGHNAIQNPGTGNYNTAVGRSAMNSVMPTNGDYNTAVGYASFAISGISNSTGIGHDATPTLSNEVRLGNSSVTKIGGYANWTNVSDRQLKADIKDYSVGLDLILNLRPVTYYLKTDASKKIHSGFIAQDVESIKAPFYGIDKPQNKNSFYSIAYSEFVVPLVNAVKELFAWLVKHEEKINSLELRLVELEKKNAEFEKIMLRQQRLIEMYSQEMRKSSDR